MKPEEESKEDQQPNPNESLADWEQEFLGKYFGLVLVWFFGSEVALGSFLDHFSGHLGSMVTFYVVITMGRFRVILVLGR